MNRVHCDDVVEGEERQRDPYGSGGGGPDFKHRDADKADRDHDRQIDVVVGCGPDLAVELLKKNPQSRGRLPAGIVRLPPRSTTNVRSATKWWAAISPLLAVHIVNDNTVTVARH
jgi:hypothetical protein